MLFLASPARLQARFVIRRQLQQPVERCHRLCVPPAVAQVLAQAAQEGGVAGLQRARPAAWETA